MIVVTFHSVSSALFLDALLKGGETPARVVPVPRELSSSCGYAVEVDTDDVDRLASLLDENEMEWEDAYRHDGSYHKVKSARS